VAEFLDQTALVRTGAVVAGDDEQGVLKLTGLLQGIHHLPDRVVGLDNEIL
jgi:hypothetical protein